MDQTQSSLSREINQEIVSVDDKQLNLLGRLSLHARIAGRSVFYPFWVMDSPVVDCILGIDLLRQLKAHIDLSSNCMGVPGADFHLRLDKPSQLDYHTASCTLSTRQAVHLLPGQTSLDSCDTSTNVTDATTIFVEGADTSMPAQVARSFNTVTSTRAYDEVSNQTRAAITLPAGHLVALAFSLPEDYLPLDPADPSRIRDISAGADGDDDTEYQHQDSAPKHIFNAKYQHDVSASRHHPKDEGQHSGHEQAQTDAGFK